jgi:hypothetical protein
MTKRGIDIGSERMYDEENLPTMDLPENLQEEFPPSLIRIIHMNYDGISEYIIALQEGLQENDSNEENSLDEGESEGEDAEPMESTERYNIAEDTFNCGCGEHVNIGDVATHMRSSHHIQWVASLSRQ